MRGGRANNRVFAGNLKSEIRGSDRRVYIDIPRGAWRGRVISLASNFNVFVAGDLLVDVDRGGIKPHAPSERPGVSSTPLRREERRVDVDRRVVWRELAHQSFGHGLAGKKRETLWQSLSREITFRGRYSERLQCDGKAITCCDRELDRVTACHSNGGSVSLRRPGSSVVV